MVYFCIVFACYMVFLGIGLFRGRRGNRRFALIAAQIYNARIDRMHSVPYSYLRGALERKQLLRAILCIAAINFGMAVTQYLLGLVLLAPFLAGLNGQITGYLFSWGDHRSVFPYGFLQAFLQFGAYSTAASAGMVIGMRWLYYDLPFRTALVLEPGRTAAVLLAALLLLFLGATVEAAGPICWGVRGIPSLEAIRQKAYLKW